MSIFGIYDLDFLLMESISAETLGTLSLVNKYWNYLSRGYMEYKYGPETIAKTLVVSNEVGQIGTMDTDRREYDEWKGYSIPISTKPSKIFSGKTKKISKIWVKVCELGLIDLAKWMIGRHGSIIQIHCSGDEALHRAICNNHFDIANWIMGLDQKLINIHAYKYLDWAVNNKNLKLVAWLWNINKTRLIEYNEHRFWETTNRLFFDMYCVRMLLWNTVYGPDGHGVDTSIDDEEAIAYRVALKVIYADYIKLIKECFLVMRCYNDDNRAFTDLERTSLEMLVTFYENLPVITP